jgi:hypothetical protein
MCQTPSVADHASEPDAEVADGPSSPAGRNVLIVAGIGLVVVIVVAALLSAGSDVTTLDPASPEGVVQGYLDATLAGDYATANTYLSAERQQQCADIVGYRNYVPENSRVVLREVTSSGDSATVKVEVTEGGGGLGGGWTHEEWYQLQREGDRWVITQAPWPYYECGFVP